MSDEMEQKIADTLKDVEPGSSEEMMLSEQLAKELGFEIPSEEIIDPAVQELLDADKAEEAPEVHVEEPADPAEEWSYTTQSGEVKSFDNEADKLRYQIGADANKWSDKFKALEAKLETRVEREPAPNQPVDPKTLLFDEAILKNEEWAPVVDQMTKAFEKYHALSVQDQDARTKGLTEQIAKLEGQLSETSVRSEYGISRSDEAKILEMQPQNVRDGLASLDPAARLAVIKQLDGKKEAPVKGLSPLPRAVSPQQAHVESSARGEPDRDPHAAFEEKFYASDEKTQQTMLGQLYKQVGGEL